jgi:hypothetical protein
MASGSKDNPSLSLPLLAGTTRVLEFDLTRSCLGQMAALTAAERSEVILGGEPCYVWRCSLGWVEVETGIRPSLVVMSKVDGKGTSKTCRNARMATRLRLWPCREAFGRMLLPAREVCASPYSSGMVHNPSKELPTLPRDEEAEGRGVGARGGLRACTEVEFGRCRRGRDL